MTLVFSFYSFFNLPVILFPYLEENVFCVSCVFLGQEHPEAPGVEKTKLLIAIDGPSESA